MIEQIQEMKAELALREDLKLLTGKNIFIRAGAGAGKSTLMVDRLTSQAMAGNQPFDQTVAITFTNKAAADLEKKVMESVADKEVILKALPELTIGTIHSFCQKILDERPIEAGLSPGFSVMEDTGSREGLLKGILAEVMDDETAEIQVSVKQLQELDQYPFEYYDLLESKVNYMELGIEEYQSTNKTVEEYEKKYDLLVKEFIQEFNQMKRYFWYTVKPGKIKFLSKTKNLSLQETIEQSYEETSSLEELLKVFLSSNEVKKLLKDEKVQAVYESGRKSEITDAIVHYIKHIFVTEFKKVDFTQENWVEKFCDNIANIEGESAWFERLDQLTATEQGREDNLEAIFDHFFNAEVTRRENEYILTSKGLAEYHNLLNLDILDEDKFALFKESFGIDGRKVSKHMKQQFAALFQKYGDEVITDSAFYELTL